MKKEILIALLLFLTAFVYAWLRYVTNGPYVPGDFLFILNKGLAFSVVLFMFVAYLPVKYRNLNRKIIGFAAYFLVLGHLLISVFLLPSHYYAYQLRPDGTVYLHFILSLASGILALFALIGVYYYFKIRRRRYINPKIFGFLTFAYFIFLALHILFFGYRNWLEPARWYGGMPPITLISVILLVFFIPLGLYFIRFVKGQNLHADQ